jgi:outer membrane protein OmpA-like peptidoglycan-associated protein
MRRSMSLFIVLLLAGCALFTQEHYAVFFQPQSAELDGQARSVIASLAEKAKQRPGAIVTVSGFADPGGDVPDNFKLSALRARAVSNALIADGVPAARIRRQSEGGVDYAIDSQESRRVEIKLGMP